MATHNLKVSEVDQHSRLDVFLAKNLSGVPSRSFVKKLIDFGHVKINEEIVKAHYKVVEGDDVFIEVPEGFLKTTYAAPENIALDIFYEDESLLVINKPRGMTVHPAPGCHSGTLVNALLYQSVNLSSVNEEMRPGIVHRLDKETSGLIIVAKDNITHTKLAKQFQRHTIKKQYIALVEGEIEFDEGVVDAPIGKHPSHHEKKTVRFDDSAKKSLTRYRVIKRSNGVTLVALFPRTGRTHQLRVHMRYLGHSILGDEKYGKRNNFARLALHAQAIAFSHPSTKKLIECFCVPPKEFLGKVGL